MYGVNCGISVSNNVGRVRYGDDLHFDLSCVGRHRWWENKLVSSSALTLRDPAENPLAQLDPRTNAHRLSIRKRPQIGLMSKLLVLIKSQKMSNPFTWSGRME